MTALLYSAENERVKRRYFTYLKGAKRYSDSSADEQKRCTVSRLIPSIGTFVNSILNKPTGSRSIWPGKRT
jgi:hypothetical protein